MSLLENLERKLARFAVPHTTIGLILGQIIVYGLALIPRPEEAEDPLRRLELIAGKVLEGEVWRLLSFVFIPPLTNPIFALFSWYLLYLMGTALEREWGTFRYNLYLLVGYLATVAVSFLLPALPASNAYLLGSIFLAFAFLYPEFELSLFFLIPVQIKWFALVTWLIYGFTLLFGDWLARLQVLAAVANFLLFFGSELWERVKRNQRRMSWQARVLAIKPPAYFHRCVVCGITDKSDPQMDFRYCSQCAGSCAYCTEHLRNHEHVVAEKSVPGTGSNQGT